VTRRTVVEREAARLLASLHAVEYRVTYSELIEEAMRRVERATLRQVRAMLRDERQAWLDSLQDIQTICEPLPRTTAIVDGAVQALDEALACCRPERTRK